MRKNINAIADLFPIMLALVFVAVIILGVCHATSSLQDPAKKSASLSQPAQTCAQQEQPKADANIEDALHSGELEILVSPIVP